jgi:hypothetical protein
MGLHGNAKLGLAGRRVMVMLVVGLGCRGGRRLHAAGCARRRRGRHAHATAWRALRRAACRVSYACHGKRRAATRGRARRLAAYGHDFTELRLR